MKSMKLLNLLLVASFFLTSCGGDSSGTITVTLNVDALSAGEQSTIEHFVFIVTSVAPGSSTSVLYPSSCLGTNGAACIENEACGFTTDQDTFDPNLSFDDFEQDSTISVTACALDSTSGYVGAGSSNIVNSDGQSATITVNNTNPCTGLPAVCP